MNFFVRHRPVLVIQRYVEINISPSLITFSFAELWNDRKSLTRFSRQVDVSSRICGRQVVESIARRSFWGGIHNHISMTASLLAGSQYIGNKLITIAAHRCPFYGHISTPFSTWYLCFLFHQYRLLPSLCSPFSFSPSSCVASPLWTWSSLWISRLSSCFFNRLGSITLSSVFRYSISLSIFSPTCQREENCTLSTFRV